jgi:hypothetical protein
MPLSEWVFTEQAKANAATWDAVTPKRRMRK